MSLLAVILYRVYSDIEWIFLCEDLFQIEDVLSKLDE